MDLYKTSYETRMRAIARVETLRQNRDEANSNFELHSAVCPDCRGKTFDEVMANFGCFVGKELALRMKEHSRELNRHGLKF